MIDSAISWWLINSASSHVSSDSDSDERMKSNKFVILQLILVMATTTSATSCLSCDPFFYSRVRTLVFGK